MHAMEDEIDLREYIAVLIRHWRMIAGLALIAAVTAASVSFFILQPQYEAKALVAVTQPRYVMRFDERFETVNNIQPAYKAYPTLATSDELLQQLLEGMDPPLPPEKASLQRLRGMLSASSGSDPSIVILTARSSDPAEAARVVNAWAELFVRRANEIYGESSEQLAFFEAQLAQADADLKAAEEALIAFQARNEAAILQAQLNSKKQSQSEYLSAQRAIVRIIQDAQSLREQLSARPAGEQVSLGDDLTTLFLEIQAFNTRTATPIQLQVAGSESLSGKTVGEVRAFLDDLVRTLENKSAEIQKDLDALKPEILSLQRSLQEVNTEKERLSRAKEVARETYMALARKVEEARIAAQDTTGEVRLASTAAVPERPVSPRKLLNTLVAGVLGLMVGIFGAFVVEYFSEPLPVATPRASESEARGRLEQTVAEVASPGE